MMWLGRACPITPICQRREMCMASSAGSPISSRNAQRTMILATRPTKSSLINRVTTTTTSFILRSRWRTATMGRIWLKTRPTTRRRRRPHAGLTKRRDCPWLQSNRTSFRSDAAHSTRSNVCPTQPFAALTTVEMRPASSCTAMP